MLNSSDFFLNSSSAIDTIREWNDNLTESPLIGNIKNGSEQGDNTAEFLTTPREIIRYIVSPIICIFGLLGNLLTLVILTRKRLKSSCDGTERTVNVGLFSLAVSDFCCCLSLLPHGIWAQERFFYKSLSFHLLYKTYSHAFINTFFLTSTWLTVTMATSRYLAICHPFRARHLIGLAGTRLSIFLVCFVCVVFNIPKFLENTTKCPLMQNNKTRCHMWVWTDGPYMKYEKAQTVYTWLYFSLGICLPLAMLAFCNICLVRVLRESSKLRRRYRVPAAHVDSNYRITSILVTIVVMYILLVSPAEILRFMSNDEHRMNIIEVANMLQTVNFACNFVLYFMLNVHFRSALKDMLLCAIRLPRRCFPALQSGEMTEDFRPSTSVTMSRDSTVHTFL